MAVEVHAKRHPSVSQGEGLEGPEGVAMSPEYERLGRLRAELARQGWWGPGSPWSSLIWWFGNRTRTEKEVNRSRSRDWMRLVALLVGICPLESKTPLEVKLVRKQNTFENIQNQWSGLVLDRSIEESSVRLIKTIPQYIQDVWVAKEYGRTLTSKICSWAIQQAHEANALKKKCSWQFSCPKYS